MPGRAPIHPSIGGLPFVGAVPFKEEEEEAEEVDAVACRFPPTLLLLLVALMPAPRAPPRLPSEFFRDKRAFLLLPAPPPPPPEPPPPEPLPLPRRRDVTGGPAYFWIT